MRYVRAWAALAALATISAGCASEPTDATPNTDTTATSVPDDGSGETPSRPAAASPRIEAGHPGTTDGGPVQGRGQYSVPTPTRNPPPNVSATLTDSIERATSWMGVHADWGTLPITGHWAALAAWSGFGQPEIERLAFSFLLRADRGPDENAFVRSRLLSVPFGGTFRDADPQSVISNQIDDLTVAAALCIEQPLDDTFLDHYDALMERGGYGPTHLLLAMIMLRTAGCESPLEAHHQEAVLSAVRSEVGISGPVTDLELEAAAWLLDWGDTEAIDEALIDRILASQLPDGGWSNGEVESIANWHSTAVGMWFVIGAAHHFPEHV